ncbi:MAG: U32 family peptidase [Spirochaetaceae bacterium]|jgi:putative protease|nr:U32 family peptidase [Spirochaetaceae bacterium]
MPRIPELLAPAGSPEALNAAIGEGADAVYLGLKEFNARQRSANFTYAQFEAALRALRRMGRRLYVTVNTVFEEREADRMYRLLKYLSVTGPDAIIVQDFGVLKMARDNFPSLKIHASTQMNIASAPAVNLISKHGVSRVVLARELSLAEIAAICAGTSAEIEVFVHGALCVSASGLCLFSSFLGGASANRGLCTQACRRYYRRRDGAAGYYFSPADLELLADIPALAGAGAASFKIEGRMKSAGYVGAVVSAYRRLLDSLERGPETALAEAREIVRNDFARKKTRFYFDGPAARTAGLPDWLDPAKDGGVGIPLGNIRRVRGSSGERRGFIAACSPPLEAGDSVRFHRSDDTERKAHKLTAAEQEGDGVWISVPEGFNAGDPVYLIQRRSAGRRYPMVIRDASAPSRRIPGSERAGEPVFPVEKTARGNVAEPVKLLPPGIYAAAARIEDLFAIQSERPVKVILALSRKNAAYLLDRARKPLPFGGGDLVLSLDPWFPEAEVSRTRETVSRLLEAGFTAWIINNPGHVSLFRGRRAALLIAGPWLYTFNRWAAAFAASLGAAALVTPLENNRQNLERTVPASRRALAFVTLFAFPPLFRIRADLSAYGFGAFGDSRGEEFRLVSGEEGSAVFPETPFSIVDKRPFLEQAGFRRFIIDFSGISGGPLKKKDYRMVMKAALSARALPGGSRFNWKDGFYAKEEDGAERPAALEGGPGLEKRRRSTPRSGASGR